MGVAKFGVSEFEYGVVKDGAVKTTRPVKGLTEVKLDLTNEMKTLAADDGPYVTISGGITEAKETISIYDVDSTMKQDLYGIELVGGTERYDKNLMPNDVATMFKTKTSDGKAVYVGMLKGKFTLPGMNAKTVDGAPDPEADEIEGTFSPRGEQENILLIGREDNEGFNLATFKSWVFPKTAEDDKVTDPKA